MVLRDDLLSSVVGAGSSTSVARRLAGVDDKLLGVEGLGPADGWHEAGSGLETGGLLLNPLGCSGPHSLGCSGLLAFG